MSARIPGWKITDILDTNVVISCRFFNSGVKTDFASIRAYYIGTWTFVVDVFAVLPVEWLALAVNAELLEQQEDILIPFMQSCVQVLSSGYLRK
jgi:hypothetical protein